MSDVQESLDEVRDYIIEYGWTQNRAYDPDTGKVCIIGGMSMTQTNMSAMMIETANRISSVENRRATQPHYCEGEIVSWNDKTGRSLDDVLTLLSDKWETLKKE